MSTPTDAPYAHVRRGRSDPMARRQTGRWSPTSGWQFDQEFSGLSSTQMEALATSYSNIGVAYEIVYENGIATMRTTDTTGTVTIDVWEICVNRTYKSVFESPKLRATIPNPQDIDVIAKAYTDGTAKLQDAVDALNSTSPPTLYTLPDVNTDGVVKRLYDQVLNKDNATYPVDEYTLRHTTNCSNRGFHNIADDYVNYFYSQTKFFTEIGLTGTGGWIFPAPSEITSALGVVFSALTTALTGAGMSSNYMVGAVKGASGRVTAANNRVNIVTEYQLGIVDTDRYYTNL